MLKRLADEALQSFLVMAAYHYLIERHPRFQGKCNTTLYQGKEAEGFSQPGILRTFETTSHVFIPLIPAYKHMVKLS